MIGDRSIAAARSEIIVLCQSCPCDGLLFVIQLPCLVRIASHENHRIGTAASQFSALSGVAANRVLINPILPVDSHFDNSTGKMMVAVSVGTDKIRHTTATSRIVLAHGRRRTIHGTDTGSAAAAQDQCRGMSRAFARKFYPFSFGLMVRLYLSMLAVRLNRFS